MEEIERQNILIDLFKYSFQEVPVIKPLLNGGSSRKYFRLSSPEHSAVGVISDEEKDNVLFLRLDRILKNAGIKVPEIIAFSPDKKNYLLQDLGDVSLFQLLGEDNNLELSKKALQDLITIQTLPEEIWGKEVGYEPFSQRLVNWDLNYFKYDFLKPTGINYDEEKLEDDFEKIGKEIFFSNLAIGFMYRDFQSRNIMVRDNDLWYIDFQGGRKGPMVYDAASFIWQAKAPFTYEQRKELGDYYVDQLSRNIGVEKKLLEAQFYLMVIFRTLQVLGAYGFRGLIQGKSHFIESIPYAVSNLQYLKNYGRLDSFPEIRKITNSLVKKFILDKPISNKEILTLTIFSFSYKKGYPEDITGNGGGFMFDCRAIHNPGRYQQYKDKTGKDNEVIEFLEKTGEAGFFVERALDIVKPSIDRYLERGFTSLQVGFGCTGGQHRSVYCAEKFASKIQIQYPQVRLKVIHREQDI